MKRRVPFWRVELLTLPFFKKDYGKYFSHLDEEDFVDSLASEELKSRSRYVRREDRRSAVDRLFFGFFERDRSSFRDLFEVYREIATNIFELRNNEVHLRFNVWKSYFLCEPEDVPLLWKYLDLLSLRDFWIAMVVLEELDGDVPYDELESIALNPFPSDFYSSFKKNNFYELHSHAGSFIHTKELWIELLVAVANKNPGVFKLRKKHWELLSFILMGYICKVAISYPEDVYSYESLIKRLLEGEGDSVVNYLTSQFLTDFRLGESLLKGERWLFIETLKREEDGRIGRFLKEVLYLYLWARTNFHRFFTFFSREGLREFIYTFRKTQSLSEFRQRILNTKVDERNGFQPKEESIRTLYEQRFSSDSLSWLNQRDKVGERGEERGRNVLIVHLLKREPRFRKEFYSLSYPLTEVTSQYQKFVLYYENSSLNITALDVASHETDLPNFLFLPAFEDVLLRAKRKRRAINFTFHAGEEFSTPFHGLRQLTEYVLFFPVGSGDRIGHGSVLSYSLSLFVKKERGEEIGALDLLFNLVLEWFLRSSGLLPSKTELIPRLEFAIQKISEKLFGELDSSELKFVTRDPYTLWKVYRHLFNPVFLLERAFYLEGITLVSPYSYLFSEGKGSYSRKVAPSLRVSELKEEERELFDYIYLYYFKLNKPMEFTFKEIEVGFEKERVRTWQKWLLKEIEKRGMFVEVCPTSNLLVVSFENMVKHPVLELPKWIDIVVATDNYLQTNSTVFEEVGLAYSTFRGLYGRKRAWIRTKELLRNAERAYFGGE